MPIDYISLDADANFTYVLQWPEQMVQYLITPAFYTC